MSKFAYQFCNNCGRHGHLYNNCDKPITSSGIIAFRKNKGKNEYLMICRKDSLGYVDFLRGKFPLYDKAYILTLIDEMTNDEKKRILSNEFDVLWTNLWGDCIGLQYRGEEKNAKDKFIQIIRGIQLGHDESYNLNSIITESKTNWSKPEWGFPKGRRNYQENDLSCGLREFEEETGYEKNNISIIKNILPYEEIFMGSNLKSYKHVYFLGKVNYNCKPTNEFQKSEVSDLTWFTLEECIKHIRNYNLEKIKIIEKVDKTLQRYRLIS